VVVEVGVVRGQVAQLVDLQAPLDAPQHRGALVLVEVVAGACAQQHQDVTQRLVVAALRRLPCRVRTRRSPVTRRRQDDLLHVLPQLQQALRHVAYRQHEIHRAGADGVARHVVVFRVLGCLGQRDAAVLLDAADADRAVRTRAREHDGYGVRPAFDGQRAEQEVDGEDAAALVRRHREVEHAVVHRQLPIGRNDVHVVALDGGGGGDLFHRHARHPGQHLGEARLVPRGQMHHHDEGHPGARRHVPKERQQRVEPAGRSADGDDRKGLWTCRGVVGRHADPAVQAPCRRCSGWDGRRNSPTPASLAGAHPGADCAGSETR
jgi:hypothetical protein